MENHTLNDKEVLNERLSRARKELEILYDISNAMRTTLELNQILYIILTGVTAHAGLGFNRAVLFLVNKKEHVLEGKLVIGPESAEDAEKIWAYIEKENQDLEDLIAAYKTSQNHGSFLKQQLQQLKIPLNADDGGLLASAYFNGQPLHIEKEKISAYINDPLLKVFKTNEIVIMPLKAKDKVNGIIIADNLFTQKPITGEDLKIFTMLANQAGLAIENSQLYEMVVHKSHTDSLTSLWNHGFFQDTLIKEIEEAKQSQKPLSLIILDIDNFKKFNDTYGHQCGDMALTQLAKILRDSSREKDFVCRYGGEEFSIILPDTHKDQAFLMAERLREETVQHHFTLTAPHRGGSLSVSVGVATFPDDAHSNEALILKADKAMYTAKFIGKNKTCLSDINET